ncbi:MAG TPA: hypothetical protein VFR11_00695 [Micromonosporaceae bacterium]|nr:hypothetical protein [Micromonosporaceae bacterium]
MTRDDEPNGEPDSETDRKAGSEPDGEPGSEPGSGEAGRRLGDEPERGSRESRRRFSAADDILRGFSRGGRPTGYRAFFATTIAASLLIWDLAFALGAYHTVFYYRLFQIFVVSTVLLLGSIVLRREMRVWWWTRVVLCIPVLWFVLRGIAPIYRSTGPLHVIEQTLTWLTLATVPLTLWALVRVMAPGLFEMRARRVRALVIVIISVVAIAGFVVGQFNSHFTNCRDYVVAGDDEPSHCRPTPGTPAPSPPSPSPRSPSPRSPSPPSPSPPSPSPPSPSPQR